MSVWESAGSSDEWYTPRYIFDALGLVFDIDVAAPAAHRTHVPARRFVTANSLNEPWCGLVWMNPPFGGRNALIPWLDKFFDHGNGVALTPDRSSAPWWQDAATRADGVLMVAGKIRFERPDGSVGVAPANGTTLFASGGVARDALKNSALGWFA